jgi:hypothetical protein
MKIAIDYDGTYTMDPKLWDWFITQATLRGHEVKIVTMRRPGEVVKNPPCEVVYTSRTAKINSYRADIWIDDQPHMVINNHWSIE